MYQFKLRMAPGPFSSILALVFMAIHGTAAAQQRPATVQGAGESLQIEAPGNGRPAALDPAQPTAASPVAADASSEWVVAPIPSFTPSQGWAIGLTAQYIFRPVGAATSEPPSIVGAGAFITQEESYGGALVYSGHLDADRWRVIAAGGYALLNYDFYGVGGASLLQGNPVRIQQDTTGGLIQVLRRIAPNVYLGPRLFGMEINAAATLSLSDLTLPTVEREALTVAVGSKLQWDTRDNVFYPTQGGKLNLVIDVFNGAIGSDFDYQSYEAEYNHYVPFGPDNVVALRAFGRLATGDVPFFDLSMFGQHGDLRGYEVGKYRDNLMLATQGEWRHRINRRFGLVAFAGVGDVASSFDALTADDLLWSAGGGVRVRIAKDNPINLRMDLAQGRDGTAIYLSVGEAF